MVLEGYFYVGVSCVALACVGLIFFGVRTVLVYLPASSFLGVCWTLSPCRRCDRGCGDRSLPWLLSGSFFLLCGCQSPVRAWICSLAVGVEAPRSFLSCSARQMRIEHSHWERSQSVSLLELFTSECALLCHLSLVALIHKAHRCWPHLLAPSQP